MLHALFRIRTIKAQTTNETMPESIEFEKPYTIQVTKTEDGYVVKGEDPKWKEEVVEEDLAEYTLLLIIFIAITITLAVILIRWLVVTLLKKRQAPAADTSSQSTGSVIPMPSVPGEKSVRYVAGQEGVNIETPSPSPVSSAASSATGSVTDSSLPRRARSRSPMTDPQIDPGSSTGSGSQKSGIQSDPFSPGPSGRTRSKVKKSQKSGPKGATGGRRARSRSPMSDPGSKSSDQITKL